MRPSDMSHIPTLEGLRISRDDKPRAKRGWGAVVIALLLLGGVAITAWSFTRDPAIEVRTVTAREVQASASSQRTVLNASGYVTARREATVSSKVTGKVLEITIEEGMKVTAGQILARIDDSNVSASLRLAQAQASAARAGLSETQVRIKEAELELSRQTALHERSVASQADFDRAEAATNALRARFEQQQAEVAVAESTVAVWQQQLDDTVIRAPFAGTVTSKNAQPGEMISPMSTGGFTRTGICTIVDMDSLEIEIDVNESYINRVQPGQAVEATLDAYSEWKLPCHVIAIIPTADRNKSTVRVRVGFDQLDPKILPDMSVKVAFRETERASEGHAPRRVVLPRNAVLTRENRPVVFIVNAGRAERRAVTTQEADPDTVFVLAGVSADESVIVQAPPTLLDGARVKPLAP